MQYLFWTTWAQIKIGDPITMAGKDNEYQGTNTGFCNTVYIISRVLRCGGFFPGDAKDDP